MNGQHRKIGEIRGKRNTGSGKTTGAAQAPFFRLQLRNFGSFKPFCPGITSDCFRPPGHRLAPPPRVRPPPCLPEPELPPWWLVPENLLPRPMRLPPP